MKAPVKGYESFYEIDTNGQVYSIRHNGLILKAYGNGTGYLKVNLYDQLGQCKKKYVHRLVAEAFIPNPNGFTEVNHIDCDKSNNSISNLEWCDRRMNLEHSYANGKKRTCETHGSSKLNWSAVHDIRSKRLSQKEYSEKYQVKQCTISAIQHYKIWKRGDEQCHA